MTSRSKYLRVRLTAEEKNELDRISETEDITVSDLIRRLIHARLTYQIPKSQKRRRDYIKTDPELLREFGKIGNNLNQLARWSNTYKRSAEVTQILPILMSIERSIQKLAEIPRNGSKNN